MSGILGVFRPGGAPVEERELAPLVAAIAHRGPDGAGTRCQSSAGLGHLAQRLAPAGRSRDAITTDGSLLLATDLRLDNRDDLAHALGAAPDARDEDLLLAGWRRYGETLPEHLEGDFAFALLDTADERLLLARDAVGARPLYYSWNGDTLVFGSEIKAVLAHPSVPRELDEEKVADYLGQVFVDRERTFHRAVRRLAPGHTLSVDRGGPRTRRYWSLDPALRTELDSDNEYAERFLALLQDALGCRMATDARVAVLLSGGLDSSGLVALARAERSRLGQGPLPTLSVTFPEFPTIDERRYIEELVAGGGLAPELVPASGSSPLGEVEVMLAAQDEPFFSPNLFLFWSLARRARELGLAVLVDGVDGDTTVGHGLEFLAELLRRGRVLRAVREARALGRVFGRPAGRFLWHFGVVPGVLAPLLGGRPPRPPATVERGFARRIAWRERLGDLLGERLRPARSLREHHHRALTSDLVPHYLEVNDKASAAFGLDHRHPYFDRRLVEFCYGTPPEQKLADGQDRVIQRRAFRGLVPEPIRRRVGKSQWGENFKRGFLETDRARIEDVLATPGRLGDYVDLGRLRLAYRRCAAGRFDEVDGMNLWLAVTLGLWLRTQGARENFASS